MAGTKAGGMKAAATNKARHGSDFYKRIGAKGGANGNTGGFAADYLAARIAGVRGGKLSIRRRRDETDDEYEARKLERRRRVLAESN